MGKKRKVGSETEERKNLSNANQTLAISTYEDVADSEDEFHINRDKILLEEGPAAKRLRKFREDDQFLEPSDEEVLGYDESDEDEEAAEDDIDGVEGDISRASSDDPHQVLEVPIDGDEDLAGWGPSKKDYYDADAITNERDALEEEAEALRIQKKQLAAMSEADFGFDEEEWIDRGGEKDTVSGVVTEILPQLRITDDMTVADKEKIMSTRYPELEYISKEFLRLRSLHNDLATASNAAEQLHTSNLMAEENLPSSSPSSTVATLKYRACAAYLAAMSMYFAVLGSTATEDGSAATALEPAELHEHGVMASLLRCQRLWTRIESLPNDGPKTESLVADPIEALADVSSGKKDPVDATSTIKNGSVKIKKSQRTADFTRAKAAAKHQDRMRRTEEELASLTSLTKAGTFKSTKKQEPKQPGKVNLLNAEDSDFGEETELTARELADKAKKKKSLRFYTSQIVQKVNKRDAAGRDYGGDVDIPHRERLKDRQARLQAQAERKGQHKDKGPGVTLGDGDESSADEEGMSNIRGGNFEDEAGYYDLIAARGSAKKQAKLDRAAAYAQAAREGGTVVPEEVIGDDGRRQITYAIEKNKGLTPHRKKSVRNPRVKKKLKYEAKKKKLKSMKPVFDAKKKASGAASYGGELTGIKKGLVRSRKL